MNAPIFIFDLGNVLIDWDPAYLFGPYFNDSQQLDIFLREVCPLSWHGNQDAGRDPAEATEERIRQFPGWEGAIRAYYSRWPEMFRGPLPESVVLLKRLKEQGHRLYALSNWNRELYRLTAHDYPFLDWFDGVLLSSDVGTKKPDPRIYLELLHRFGIDPKASVFIDDREENVRAAENVGMQGIVFESAAQLEAALNLKGF